MLVSPIYSLPSTTLLSSFLSAMAKTVLFRLPSAGVAVISVLLALVLMLALNPLAHMTQTPFLLFFGAVVISAWQGGVRAGLLATVLSALISNYFFLQPTQTLGLDLSNSLRLFVFAVECSVISMLCGSLRTTNQRLDRNLLRLKASEASLRYSEGKFCHLVEANIFGVTISDFDGNITYANEAWLNLLGYSHEDMTVGQLNYLTLIPAEQLKQFDQAKAELQKYGRFKPFEQNYLHKDGHQIPLLLGGALLQQPNPQDTQIICFYLDLTEQKQTETALRASEERFRLAAQAIAGVVYDWDIPTQTVFRSEGLYRLNGFHPKELASTHSSWLTCIHPDDRQPIETALDEAIASDRDRYEFEYRIQHQQGHWLTVSDQGHLIRDAQGQVIRIVGFVTDITARKQAETALKNSERLYRAIGETIDYGIWVTDPNGRDIYASESFLNLIGLTQEECGDFGWISALHPDDAEQTIKAWKACIKSGTFWDTEHRFRGVDGQWHPILARGVPVRDENDQIIYWAGINLDISRQKQVETELRHSQEQFRALIEHAPDAIFIADLTGTYIDVNPSACQLLGYERDELIGKQITNLIPADELPRLHAIKESLLAGNTHVEEWHLRRQDGTFVLAEVSTKILPDRRWQAFVRDITDRKEAEEALRLSEARYRTLANAVPQLMWVNDAQGKMQFYNERWQEYTGAPIETWDTLPLEIIHPDDVQYVMEVRNQAIHSNLAYEVEARLKRYDQIYRWHLARILPLKDETGQVSQWFGTATDIQAFKQTEVALRQSEERYRYLVESIPQLVWTANDAGVIMDVNQRWVDYTGLTLEQVQLAGWEAIVYPDDIPALSQHWAAAQHNGTYYQAEGRMQRQDGTYRWFLHQAIPLKDEHGQIIRWFGTATDIEIQKQLEQQRDRILQTEQAAREEAERANRIKDEFLAVLSHELRSPLNPILGWTKLLRTRRVKEEKFDLALETIERNAKLQAQLIEDLLDVSRILRGKTVLNVSPVNLVKIIQAAIETVRLSAEAKQIEIKSQLTNDNIKILGDSARLQQIIWNLLSNAIKFTPECGRVEIYLDQVNTHAQIQVKDTGKGINPEFLPHVFEYFRQEDGTTTRKFGGLGLGLAIVRHLTELHGGTVQADSLGEDQGATFTVTIPLLKTALQQAQAATPSDRPIQLEGIRILVVDDEADMRELMSFILEQYGAHVKTVASAQAALDILESFQPDILISDIGMPVTDGYTLMHQLRQRSPEQFGQIPAIALTAYAGEADQKQALEAGFHQHLAKPIEPDELVTAIATLLNRR